MTLPGLVVDPAPEGALLEARNLFPASGEFRRAVERLRGEGILEKLPPEAVLHLYAYEVLERLREEENRRASPAGKRGEEGPLLRIPFWPSALFEGARIPAHAAREIQSLFPPFRKRLLRMPPEGILREKAEEVLGLLDWDPHLYARSLRSLAKEEGWETEEGKRGGAP